MSINPVTAMDVDSPSGAPPLKRSSSAPMINDINTTMSTSPSTSSATRDTMSFNLYNSQPRTRRFSASFSPGSGSPGPRLTPRITQLRQEELVDTSNLREVAHERDTHREIKIFQSWEDLTLLNEAPGCKNNKDQKMTPLHLNLPSCQPTCSSPSPTRAGWPSMPWNKPSPSPTRKPMYMTRRSLSPIAMRPSPLGSVKRKLDEEKLDMYSSPRPKRLNNHNQERGGLLVTHNNTSSPLPGSLSSIGTPESFSSGDSPGGFTFRPVDSPSPNRPMQTPDEPMQEGGLNQEMQHKVDQIMATVEQSQS